MRMRNLFFKLIGLLVIVASAGGAWLWMEYQAFRDNPLVIPGDGWRYEVMTGATLRTVARDLQAQGVLAHPEYLRWMARTEGYANRIRVGEYEFSARTTPREFLEKIVSGKVVQYTLTIIEGWTFRQLRDAVAAHGKLTHTLDRLADAEVMVKLGYAELHPEGRFLPDTYAFPKGMSDVDFLRRAYTSMHEYLTRAWPERAWNLPFTSKDEALTLASIVEKETGAPHERPTIAGVFVRRLQKGMRLQTDPTVVYGLGDRYDGNIRRRDLLAESPYNTYRNKGLPPTPIALPGKDAINAALHPEGGNALYFVARGDGSHEFSETIEQHNRAVMKYQIKPARAATQKGK